MPEKIKSPDLNSKGNEADINNIDLEGGGLTLPKKSNSKKPPAGKTKG